MSKLSYTFEEAFKKTIAINEADLPKITREGDIAAVEKTYEPGSTLSSAAHVEGGESADGVAAKEFLQKWITTFESYLKDVDDFGKTLSQIQSPVLKAEIIAFMNDITKVGKSISGLQMDFNNFNTTFKAREDKVNKDKGGVRA